MKYAVTIALLFVALSGCSDDTPSNAKNNSERMIDATGRSAMWFHLSFEVEHRGKKIIFDQMVNCKMERQPGGSFGATPPSYSLKEQPSQLGRKLDDGSYLVVRVPALCHYNRRYPIDEPEQQALPGWKEKGPFDVLPLTVWNDRRPNTTQVEVYFSQTYYAQPDARFRNASGRVEFMPLGWHPNKADEILALKNVGAYGDRSYLSSDGKRQGLLLDGFQTWAMVPISNLNLYREKIYGEYAPRVWKRNRGYKDNRFVSYSYEDMLGNNVLGGGDFSSPQMIKDCITKIMLGAPLQTNMRTDPYEFGPMTELPAFKKLEAEAQLRAQRDNEPFRSQHDVRKIQIEQKASCARRLSAIQSLSIERGTLVPGVHPKGALIYRFEKFQQMSHFGNEGGSPNVLVGGDILKRTGIIEDRKTGQWFDIFLTREVTLK